MSDNTRPLREAMSHVKASDRHPTKIDAASAERVKQESVNSYRTFIDRVVRAKDHEIERALKHA